MQTSQWFHWKLMLIREYQKQTVNRALFILYGELIKTEMMSPKNADALKPLLCLKEFTNAANPKIMTIWDRHCVELYHYFSAITKMSKGLSYAENCPLFQ